MSTCTAELKKLQTTLLKAAEDISTMRLLTGEIKTLVRNVQTETVASLASIYNRYNKDLPTMVKEMERVLYQESDTLTEYIKERVGDTIRVAIRADEKALGTTKPYNIIRVKGTDSGTTVKFGDGKNEWEFTFPRGEYISIKSTEHKRYARYQDNSGKSLEGAIREYETRHKNQSEYKKVRELVNKLKGVERLEDPEDLRKSLYKVEEDMFLLRQKGYQDSLSSTPGEDLETLAKFNKVDEFTTTKEALISNLQKLYALGKNKVSQEVMDHYERIINGTKQEFFQDLQLVIRNTTKDTKGWYNAGKGVIAIQVSKAKDIYQTPAEVYMHELVHAFTYWALRDTSSEAVKVRRSLRYAQLQAQKKTKIEDLLTVDKKVATKEDWNRASSLYSYLFSDKTSLDEFTAYAMTNPKFMEHLGKVRIQEHKATTIFEVITKAVNVIIDVMMGNYSFKDRNGNVKDQVYALAFRLGEINQKSREDIVRLNPIGIVSDLVNQGLDFLDEKAAKGIAVITDKMVTEGRLKEYPENGTVLEKADWAIKAAVKGVSDKVYRDVITAWLSQIWSGFKPEGDIRQFVSDLFPEDEGKSLATWLTLKNNHIDGLRNTVAYQTISSIKDSFNRPITDAQEEALTAVLLDTDIGHMVYTQKGRKGIDNQRLIELIEDDKKIATAKKLIKNKIDEKVGNSARANVIKDQAMLLGIYQATGKVTEATIFSAKAIAMGHGTQARYKHDVELESMVKELASLWAIENVDAKQREAVAELLRTERKAVYGIIDAYEGFKYDSKQDLFDGDEVHMIEGYSKELFEPGIEVVVDKVSKKADMEAKGFTYRGPVKLRATNQKEPMGYYVSSVNSRAERQKGAINLGDLAARGTSITEINYRENSATGKSASDRDIAVYNRKADQMVLQMAKGQFDLSKVEWGVARVTDAVGKVVDFRVMIDKAMKKEVLQQDTRVSEVLGWSVASIQNKVLTKLQNKEVLEAIKIGMEEWEGGTFSGDTGHVEYDLIGPDATDPDMKELYYMLPEEFKKFINARADKTMAVRRDLRLIMFGYKHPQLSNMLGLNKLGPVAKAWIDKSESLWFDLVALAKGTILLKMPWVITTNIISNLLQVVTMGVGIGEAIHLHSESIKDVRKYVQDSREKLALELAVKKLKANLYRVENKFGVQRELREIEKQIKLKQDQLKLLQSESGRVKATEELQKLEDKRKELLAKNNTSGDRIERKIAETEARIKALDAGLRDNPVRELVDAGLMQALVEDVNTASVSDNNAITKWVDDVMQNAPGVVKSAGEVLYLTQNTAWYKVMQGDIQANRSWC